MLRILLLSLLALPVWAQQAQAPIRDGGVSAVEKLTAADKDKVAAILGQQQRNFGEACTTIKLLKAETLSIAEPIVLDAQGKPSKGRWSARYSVDTCGKIALRTVMFAVVPGGIAIEPLVPGDTLTDDKLQVDVTKSFSMAGQVAMPQCRDEAVIRDTKVRVFPKTGKDKWLEMWVGHLCGRDLGQVVEFLPTQTGTTFKMSLPTKSVKPLAQ